MLKGTTGRRRYLDRLRRDICRDWWLYAMLLPGLVYIIIFKYLPMYGVTIAFKNYRIFKGFADSTWCGMENFIKLFSRADFLRALQNSIIISVEKLIFGFSTPIILSLMINEVRHRIAKKGIQIAVILPNFISWIVINGLLYAMFSTTSGVIVGLMRSFGMEGPVPNILADKNGFRAVILISYL